MPEFHITHDSEQQRLSALHATGLLDSGLDPEFDQIVQLAAAICGVPYSSCNFIDERRTWFKASVGLPLTEMPRELSFCTHTIEQPGLLLVEDAVSDERFSSHPHVTGGMGIRFYAGMPLPDPAGHVLGTLCVADTVPRQLTDSQKTALQLLTKQLQVRIELATERRNRQADLREREMLLQALHSNDHRFRAFMDNGPFLSYIRDTQGRFVFYNQNLADKFSITAHQWIGKSITELFPPEFAARYLEADAQGFASSIPIVCIEESKDPDGSSVFWRSSKFTFLDEHGQQLLGGISVNITDEYNVSSALEKTNARLEHLAHIDSLTGLANRHAGDRALLAAAALAQKALTPLSVVMLDLDNFKHRNDTHGHASGDEVLRQLGVLIRRVLRSSDVAIRYGGEEFLLVLSNTDAAAALRTAERIREALHKATWPDTLVTASFGIATTTAEELNTLDPHHLVELADQAMYEAKTTGKDRIVTSKTHFEQFSLI